MSLARRPPDHAAQLGLSLRRNFSWTVLGNGIYTACQWGIVAVLAKIGTVEMVGVFALGLAITAPIQMFFQMQLRGVQATDARNEHTFNHYFSLRVLTTIIALLVSLGVALVGEFSIESTMVIGLIGLGKSVDSIADVFYGAFQRIEQMDVIARAHIMNGVLSVVFFGAGFWLSNDLTGGALGYVVGSFVPLVFYIIPTASKLEIVEITLDLATRFFD